MIESVHEACFAFSSSSSIMLGSVMVLMSPNSDTSVTPAAQISNKRRACSAALPAAILLKILRMILPLLVWQEVTRVTPLNGIELYLWQGGGELNFVGGSKGSNLRPHNLSDMSESQQET